MGAVRAGKVVDLDRLAVLLDERRRHGMTVALCHGCFDLVHIGHVDHLRLAGTLADVVTVSVSQDPVCAKGPGRPAFGLRDRMDLIAALEVVDWVVASPAVTAVDVIDVVRPDLFVKGPDYGTPAADLHAGLRSEAQAVERWGGRVHLTGGRTSSSSALLARFGRPGQGTAREAAR